MAIKDHRNKIIEMRLSGMSTIEIGKCFGVCNSIISRYLIDWGYRTRTRRNGLGESDNQKAGQSEGGQTEFEPGKRYGDYTYLETVHGATTLHRFRHKCGWTETFTEAQWKERTA